MQGATDGNTTARLDEIVRELRARQQITDCLMRYCRGVDRLDRDMILSAYHPGARDNHGSFDGPIEDFSDWVISNHAGKVISSVHHMGNVLLTIDGPAARSESYVLVNHRRVIDGQLFDLLSHGRLLDRFEERDGEWRIAERHVIIDWDRLDPVERQFGGALTEDLLKSERSPADPSYRLLAWPA